MSLSSTSIGLLFAICDKYWYGHSMRICPLDSISGIASNIDYEDIANLNHVSEVGLWDCEIPVTPTHDY